MLAQARTSSLKITAPLPIRKWIWASYMLNGEVLLKMQRQTRKRQYSRHIIQLSFSYNLSLVITKGKTTTTFEFSRSDKAAEHWLQRGPSGKDWRVLESVPCTCALGTKVRVVAKCVCMYLCGCSMRVGCTWRSSQCEITQWSQT